MKFILSVEHRPKGVGKPVRRCTDFNDSYLRSDMDYFYISAKKPDGELVGQACIEKDSNYIFSVSVNPDYQGIGLGYKFLSCILNLSVVLSLSIQ